jgi:hypothetical protein
MVFLPFFKFDLCDGALEAVRLDRDLRQSGSEPHAARDLRRARQIPPDGEAKLKSTQRQEKIGQEPARSRGPEGANGRQIHAHERQERAEIQQLGRASIAHRQRTRQGRVYRRRVLAEEVGGRRCRALPCRNRAVRECGSSHAQESGLRVVGPLRVHESRRSVLQSGIQQQLVI